MPWSNGFTATTPMTTTSLITMMMTNRKSIMVKSTKKVENLITVKAAIWKARRAIMVKVRSTTRARRAIMEDTTMENIIMEIILMSKIKQIVDIITNATDTIEVPECANSAYYSVSLASPVVPAKCAKTRVSVPTAGERD